jgi:hypothetical protein
MIGLLRSVIRSPNSLLRPQRSRWCMILITITWRQGENKGWHRTWRFLTVCAPSFSLGSYDSAWTTVDGPSILPSFHPSLEILPDNIGEIRWAVDRVIPTYQISFLPISLVLCSKFIGHRKTKKALTYFQIEKALNWRVQISLLCKTVDVTLTLQNYAIIPHSIKVIESLTSVSVVKQ